MTTRPPLAPSKEEHHASIVSDCGGDGTHPSESGRREVADLLLKFFTTEKLARGWFVKERGNE